MTPAIVEQPAKQKLGFKHDLKPKIADLDAIPGRPWDRLPYESEEAFEAFSYFRDLGALRSVPSVAYHLGKSLTLNKRWASQWSWVERVSRYDDFEQRARVRGKLEAQREMSERYARAGQTIATLGLRRMLGDPGNGVDAVDLNKLAPEKALQFVREGAQLESTHRGLPQELRDPPPLPAQVNVQVNISQQQIDQDLITMVEKLGLSSILDPRIVPGAAAAALDVQQPEVIEVQHPSIRPTP